MIKPQLPHRSSTSSVVFWFLIILSFLLSFLFSSLFLFPRVLGVFTFFSGGNRCGGVACFACYFYVFLCRVLALVFALEEGGGGSQLESSVVFPLVVCSVD